MSPGAHGLSCAPAQADSLLTMFDPLSSGEGNVQKPACPVVGVL